MTNQFGNVLFFLKRVYKTIILNTMPKVYILHTKTHLDKTYPLQITIL